MNTAANTFSGGSPDVFASLEIPGVRRTPPRLGLSSALLFSIFFYQSVCVNEVKQCVCDNAYISRLMRILSILCFQKKVVP